MCFLVRVLPFLRASRAGLLEFCRSFLYSCGFRTDSQVRCSRGRTGRNHRQFGAHQRLRGVARRFGAGAPEEIPREEAQVLQHASVAEAERASTADHSSQGHWVFH